MSSESLQINFVCYYSLASNSGAQIFSLANHLAVRGHSVTVFVPFAPEATAELGEAAFRTLPFTALDGFAATTRPARGLFHVWTTRENVRHFVTTAAARLGLPYVIHLEDNEPLITATNTGVPFDELARRTPEELAGVIGERMTHPHHFQPFLAQSAGVTGLIDRLMEFAPAGKPQLVYWPGFNETLFREVPRNDALRRSHGIADHEICLTYAGNVSGVNCAEVRSLYLSVAVLNRLGLPAKLVRAGEDYAPILPVALTELEGKIVHLGRQPHHAIPALNAMADFLVQPGRADPFNDYRFPSKLPEFFATGRPVLLPPTNLGRFVRDGLDAVILREGHALEIAESIAQIVRTPGLAATLSGHAVDFARKHFLWSDIAARVEQFYRELLPHQP